jgi:hypothetical protein
MRRRRQERPHDTQTHDQYDRNRRTASFPARLRGDGLAAGVVAAGMPAEAAMPVVETMVEIKTPDGTATRRSATRPPARIPP